MMKLKSLDHVLLVADDLEATKDFYVDVIGLTVGARPDFTFRGYWLYSGDRACIHLAARADREGAAGKGNAGGSSRTTGPIDHVAFAVDDCDGARADLDRRGVAYEHKKVPGAPLQQLFLTDPNGVLIELNFPA